MSNSTKTLVIGLILALLVALASYFGGRVKGREIGWKAGYSEGYAAPRPADTLTITDTLLVDRPVEVVRYTDRLVYVPVTDTLNVHDTTFIALPREVVQYADTTYRAQVSGIQPALDWIEVYQRTQTITNYIEKYKYPTFILSPTARVEVLPMSVFAGAGIAADYWTGVFQLSLELGYGVNGILGELPTSSPDKEFKAVGSRAGIYGALGVKVNLIRK